MALKAIRILAALAGTALVLLGLYFLGIAVDGRIRFAQLGCTVVILLAGVSLWIPTLSSDGWFWRIPHKGLFFAGLVMLALPLGCAFPTILRTIGFLSFLFGLVVVLDAMGPTTVEGSGYGEAEAAEQLERNVWLVTCARAVGLFLLPFGYFLTWDLADRVEDFQDRRQALEQRAHEADLRDALGDAIRSGASVQEVLALVEQGASVKHGLLEAATAGSPDLVSALLEAGGVPVPRYGDSSLVAALEAGRVDNAAVLLDHPDVDLASVIGPGRKVWEAAIGAKTPGSADLLIAHGADVDEYLDVDDVHSPMGLAIREDDADAAAALVKHHAKLYAKGDRTPLLHAIARGNLEVVSAMVDAGAEIGSRELGVAAGRYDHEIADMLLTSLEQEGARPTLHYITNLGAIDYLVSKGASVHAREPQYGRTALMCAAADARLEVARALLDAGSDLRATDRNRQTAHQLAFGNGLRELFQAHAKAAPPGISWFDVESDNISSVAKALDAGALVDATDSLGRTLLMHACKHEAVGVAKLLVEGGADVRAVDLEGRTALSWVEERAESSPRSAELAALLANDAP